MTRKGESITLSLTPEEKQALEELALELGETWGDRPNISQLMRAIASNKYRLVLASAPEAEYVDKLRDAVKQAESSLRKLKRMI